MSIKVLELVLIVIAALGIGFWQLYDVNKELKKDRANERDKDRDRADHDPESDSG